MTPRCDSFLSLLIRCLTCRAFYVTVTVPKLPPFDCFNWANNTAITAHFLLRPEFFISSADRSYTDRKISFFFRGRWTPFLHICFAFGTLLAQRVVARVSFEVQWKAICLTSVLGGCLGYRSLIFFLIQLTQWNRKFYWIWTLLQLQLGNQS